ncbi:MAG: ribosome maturation factor RimM [Candidatus Lightella neohaematopini]|nr:ribosome maturation factor RimM [Candidatus Lightella neohaematopini]
MNNPIVVGKIRSTYGVLGWLKLHSFTRRILDIFSYQPLFINGISITSDWRKLSISSWRLNKNYIILKITNINSKEEAKLLTNYNIFIDRKQLPVLNNTEYYWIDIIGLKVINTENYFFGMVHNIIETKANDVLVVKKNINDHFNIYERFIPYLQNQVIKKIDIQNKIIVVFWNPEY